MLDKQTEKPKQSRKSYVEHDTRDDIEIADNVHDYLLVDMRT